MSKFKKKFLGRGHSPPQQCRIKVGAIDAAALGPYVK